MAGVVVGLDAAGSQHNQGRQGCWNVMDLEAGERERACPGVMRDQQQRWHVVVHDVVRVARRCPWRRRRRQRRESVKSRRGQLTARATAKAIQTQNGLCFNPGKPSNIRRLPTVTHFKADYARVSPSKPG